MNSKRVQEINTAYSKYHENLKIFIDYSFEVHIISVNLCVTSGVDSNNALLYNILNCHGQATEGAELGNEGYYGSEKARARVSAFERSALAACSETNPVQNYSAVLPLPE